MRYNNNLSDSVCCDVCANCIHIDKFHNCIATKEKCKQHIISRALTNGGLTCYDGICDKKMRSECDGFKYIKLLLKSKNRVSK